MCALSIIFQVHHSIIQINLTLDLYSSVVKLHRELRENKVCYGAMHPLINNSCYENSVCNKLSQVTG